MLLYAKIVDKNLKICDVGTKNNEAYYKKLGLTLQEVEKGFDGQYYLKGKAPKEPTENIAKKLEVDIEKINLSQIRDIAIILTSKDSEKVKEAEEYLKTKQIEKEKIVNSIKNLGRI